VPTFVDRSSMLMLLTEEFAAVAALGSELTEAEWAEPTCLPGWSVRDNLSHMIGTESMLLQLTAPPSDVPPESHVKNPIGQANELWVASMRTLTGPQLLARFEDVTARRLDALGAMSQEDFDAPSWTPAGPDETYGRFMRIRHFDCFMHEHDMRAALGAAERPDAAHVTSCLDEVGTGLGFVVGKRAGLPSGSRVRIELTGAVDRIFLVSVDQRATVVEQLTEEPTVILRLPALLFLRLTGGREDASPHLGQDLTLEGDLDLATTLARNLAFTI